MGRMGRDWNDRIVAGVDLVGRSGGTGFEVGFVREDCPVEEAGWYATATYKGAKVFVEECPGPMEATEALARVLLNGATCTHCGKTVSLDDDGPGCIWKREGNRWERGCRGTRPISRRIRGLHATGAFYDEILDLP